MQCRVENKNSVKSVSGAVRNTDHGSSASLFQFTDNRPQTVHQRKIQDLANEKQSANQPKKETSETEIQSLGFEQKEEERPAEERKKEAHEWVTAKLEVKENLPELDHILDEAKELFNLSKIEVKKDGKHKLSFGYYASPGSWYSFAIGNNLSDQLLPIKYGFDRLFTQNPADGKAAVPQFGPVTGRNMGSFMHVVGLNKKNVNKGGNETDSKELRKGNPTYDKLLLRKTATGNSYYVAAHLLRGKLGGPGDNWENLTALSQVGNNFSENSHLHRVEEYVTKEVSAGNKVTYVVQPIYGRWPWQWPGYFTNMFKYWSTLGEIMAAEDHVPTGIHCKWWVQDRTRLGYWIPNAELIKQWRFEVSDPYWVEVDGELKNLRNEWIAWTIIEVPAKILIGTALWQAMPMLGGFLISKHLLRGLAADFAVEMLSKATDLLPVKGISTKIAARSAVAGYLASLASVFGRPEIQHLDKLIVFVYGSMPSFAKYAAENKFDVEVIVADMKDKVSPIMLSRIEKASLALLTQFTDSPTAPTNVPKTVGNMIPKKCIDKTNGKCKAYVCNAGKEDGDYRCDSHHPKGKKYARNKKNSK